jgi:hypothetical protein
MIDQFLAEFRNNWRLRALLAAAIGVLWLYGIISLRELAIARQQQYFGLERQIARIRQQSSQTDWWNWRVACGKIARRVWRRRRFRIG